MALYRYRAVDDFGEQRLGALAANNEHALFEKLKLDGYWLLEAKEESFKKKTGVSRKFTRRDIIDLFIALSTMLSAGVPLLESIDSIAEQTENPAIKHAMHSIAISVHDGMGLSEAMAMHAHIFPSQVTTIVSAGEMSGRMPETFAELRRYYEWVDELMGEIKQASTYPVIVLLVVFVFIMVLFSFVVPQFTVLLEGVGVALPLVTQLVIGLSDAVVVYWWLIVSLPVLLWFGVQTWRKKSSLFAQRFDAMKLNLPVFGEMNRMIALSRFSHHFAMMYQSGISILDCLHLCRGLVGNAKLAAVIQEVEHKMGEGEGMLTTLQKHQAFSPMLLQMVKVGESTGQLDLAMEQVSSYYDVEIPRRIKRVFAVLEPAVMFGLILIVGTVAMAIFLPLISLMGGIQ